MFFQKKKKIEFNQNQNIRNKVKFHNLHDQQRLEKTSSINNKKKKKKKIDMKIKKSKKNFLQLSCPILSPTIHVEMNLIWF